MKINAIYTITEGAVDFHLFTSAAGGYSNPFRVFRRLEEAIAKMQEIEFYKKVSALDLILLMKDDDGAPLLIPLLDNERIVETYHQTNEYPYHIRLNMDQGCITFEFSPSCTNKLVHNVTLSPEIIDRFQADAYMEGSSEDSYRTSLEAYLRSVDGFRQNEI